MTTHSVLTKERDITHVQEKNVGPGQSDGILTAGEQVRHAQGGEHSSIRFVATV